MTKPVRLHIHGETSIIPALGKLRQENHKFKASIQLSLILPA